MKKSMQVIAMVAFFGCWTIMVIAAGKDKDRLPEKCNEEWKKALQPEAQKNNRAVFKVNKKDHEVCSTDHQQEFLLPAQLFRALI